MPKTLKETLDGSSTLIWDMDGVIVDVSKSYREAIRRSAQEYSGIECTVEDVSLIKIIVGLNNDWDASLVLYLYKTEALGEDDLAEFAQSISKFTNRTDAKRYEFNYLTDVSPEDVLNSYNAIYELFQGYYLGTETTKGLIYEEELLISLEALEFLYEQYGEMAVATGRPKEEAIMTITAHKLEKYFPISLLVAEEDVEHSKPDPEPLEKAYKQFHIVSNGTPCYIGDAVGDVVASVNAGYYSIYIGDQAMSNDIEATLSFATMQEFNDSVFIVKI